MTASRNISIIDREDAGWIPIITLVLCTCCLTVGGVGLTLSYFRPPAPLKECGPVQAELLQVDLTEDPIYPPDANTPPPDPSQPPPILEKQQPTPAPALTAVAEPNPLIAFALPVEGPVRVVEASRASFVRQETPPAPALPPTPAAQTLTYGQGEGKQAKPDYPARAIREGQEGTVVVRLTVGEDGRVLAADALRPAPWPLLNEAALRAVRDRWHFRAGAIRVYDVPIRFALSK